LLTPSKKEGNLGLVLELPRFVSRFRLLDAQKRFSVMPMSTVASLIKKPQDETPAFVHDVIAEGVLNAHVVSATGAGADGGGDSAQQHQQQQQQEQSGLLLRFFTSRSDGPLAKTEQQLCNELVLQAERTAAIVERARVADRKIRFTKEHNEVLRRAKEAEAHAQAAGGGGGGSGSGGAKGGGASGSFLDSIADSMDMSHEDEDLMVD
jgi:hypothetical protein